jgi:hypothetical protein
MAQITGEILSANEQVRYAALYADGQLETSAKSDVAGTSAGESDKCEELLVNPTILKLATQRGNIDCGGAQFVLIRYGNLYQWVRPVRGGHISVCIELGADPIHIGAALEPILQRHGLL